MNVRAFDKYCRLFGVKIYGNEYKFINLVYVSNL